jgi:hypothetical protein
MPAAEIVIRLAGFVQVETPVFGNTVMAADEARTDTYGSVKEIPAKVNAALASAAGNAQEVADAVLRIIETPAGEKQLAIWLRSETSVSTRSTPSQSKCKPI